MKKSITWRSIISMILALILCVSLPVTIWAETTEVVDTSDPITNEDGTKTVLTTTTTTTIDGDKTTVTVKVEEATDGTTTDGTKVDRDVTSTTTTIDTSTSTQTETTEKGTEKKEYSEDVQPGDKVPDLKLDYDLDKGTASGKVEGEKVEETTGDLPTDENDKDYDFTTTESTYDREATGSITIEESFEINPDESSVHSPVTPKDYEDRDFYDGYQEGEIKNYRDGMLSGETDSEGNFHAYDEDYVASYGYDVDGKPTTEGFEEGYDMTWSGYGGNTDGAVAVIVKNLVYLTDENGEIVYENGFPVVDMEKSEFVEGSNGKQTPNYGQATGMVTQSSMFALQHQNGEYFYAYCMDASTSTGPNPLRWYNITNLEELIEPEEGDDDENTYITNDEAGMIRAIALNGYWGTESGQGSLESMKELLRETYAEGDKINVRYPGSNEATEYDIYSLIDSLTEHEALAVTQAAIWTYANNEDVTYNQKTYGGLVENASVIGVLSAIKFYNSKGGALNEYMPAADGESDARLQALYYALLGLEPVYADSVLREDSTVIPNEDVFSDVSLVIMEKLEDNTAVDEEGNEYDNDTYNTNLNFKLNFIPGPKDSMLVQINYVDLDGNPVSITRRLAGENADGESYIDIKPDANGNYTIENIKLSENQDFVFDLKLEGTQYLENGVYVYQAEGGRKESQTLVGLAEGEQKVVVTTKMTLNFNVEEKKSVVEVHEWSKHSDPVTEEKTPDDPTPTPNDPTPTPNDPTPTPTPNNPTPNDPEPTPEQPVPYSFDEEIEDEEVPLNEEPEEEEDYEEDDEIEILDEEVPLAEVPETGDASDVMMMIVIFAAVGLIVVNLPAKKRYNA